MAEKSEIHILLKLVYGFHVFLTVVSLLGTIYLAFELHETQVEFRDYKETHAIENVKDEQQTSGPSLVDNKKMWSNRGELNQNETEKLKGKKRKRRSDNMMRLQAKMRRLEELIAESKSAQSKIKPLPNRNSRLFSRNCSCREGVPGPPGRIGLQGPPGQKGEPGNFSTSYTVSPRITSRPPKLLILKEGDKLNLTCQATGVPPPSITWFKGNTTLPSTVHFAGTTKTATVEFTKLIYNNSGMYHCEARNVAGETTVNSEVIFPVPPKRTLIESSVGYKGEKVTIRCPVYSYPSPKMKWMRPNNKLQYVIDELTIMNVEQSDQGVYLCEGKNKYGTTFSATSLQVRNKVKPTFLVKPLGSKGMFQDEEIEINCEATGDPLPNVFWIKNGKKMSTSKLHKKTSSVIIIESFKTKDEGNYTCIADNMMGDRIIATTILYLVKCPILSPPTNGYKTSLIKESKHVALFSCNNETTLVGSTLRICQKDATWTGTTTYCLGNTLNDGSVILLGHDDYKENLTNWLDPVASNASATWALCYRATRDGWSALDFHGSCGGHESTVTIIKVGQYIFGGYSDVKFQVPVPESPHRHNTRSSRYNFYTSYNQIKSRSDYCKSSSKSFIFSLKNSANSPPFQSKQYQNRYQAICTDPREGPGFSSDIIIKDYSGKNNKSSSYFGQTYQPPSGFRRNRGFLAGSQYFQPEEIEVFYEI